jgi:hypothetical protein
MSSPPPEQLETRTKIRQERVLGATLEELVHKEVGRDIMMLLRTITSAPSEKRICVSRGRYATDRDVFDASDVDAATR